LHVRQDLKSVETLFDGQLGAAIKPIDLNGFSCGVAVALKAYTKDVRSQFLDIEAAGEPLLGVRSCTRRETDGDGRYQQNTKHFIPQPLRTFYGTIRACVNVAAVESSADIVQRGRGRAARTRRSVTVSGHPDADFCGLTDAIRCAKPKPSSHFNLFGSLHR
jgi:hypothetical protein